MANRIVEDTRIDLRLKAMFADWSPPIPPCPEISRGAAREIAAFARD